VRLAASQSIFFTHFYQIHWSKDFIELTRYQLQVFLRWIKRKMSMNEMDKMTANLRWWNRHSARSSMYFHHSTNNLQTVDKMKTVRCFNESGIWRSCSKKEGVMFWCYAVFEEYSSVQMSQEVVGTIDSEEVKSEDWMMTNMPFQATSRRRNRLFKISSIQYLHSPMYKL